MSEKSALLPPRKRFKHEKGSELPLVDLAEIVNYTGDSIEVAREKTMSCRQDLADEWNKKSPQTVEEVREFYTLTSGYLYDLYTWAHDPSMWKLFDEIITGDEHVLDYGAGIGDITIYLAEKGCDVVAIDLDNSPTKQFLQWRVYSRHLGDKVKFRFDEKKDEFDVVLAIDVLEHLYFPLRYVVQLSKLLKTKESWFFATPTFRDDHGVHPMHIKDNFWLEKWFPTAMISLAFKPKFIVDEYLPIWHPGFKTTPQGESRI